MRRFPHRSPVLVLSIAAALGSAVLGISAAGAASPNGGGRSEHERIVEFWTNERVQRAIPRDMIRDPATGRGRVADPAAGKPGGGSGSGTVTGASWTGSQVVQNTTGKVFFQMGASYYVCSGSVVTENSSGRSVVLTAGHCAYDEGAGAFATNWMFVPNYDANPAAFTFSSEFCATTTYGCWTATALVVRSEYATAGGFNEQATLHDWAFAVVGPGGKATGNSQLDDVAGSQAIDFLAQRRKSTTYAFGYPAAQKYKGNDLVYCAGPLGFDPLSGDQTYRLGCDMTGGSSGGPWFASFSTSSGKGTLMSVNSYGYQGVTAMHGPIFNTETLATFNAALTANGNTTTGP